jgi:hypothetical protein
MVGALPGAAIIGNYKAWLSDDTGSPDSRFRRSAQPYEMPDDNAEIASSYAALVAGPGIATFLDRTETGDPVSGDVGVWTNTRHDGTHGTSNANSCPDPSSNLNCGNWGSTSGSVDGGFGRTDRTNCAWTAWSRISCSSATGRHLYCFQQT